MGIRHWLKRRLVGGTSEGDVPPNAALMDTVLRREPERVRSLGEYDADSYPADLAELLRRRAEVAERLLRIDVADRQARIDAIPELREMLRTYPHPLVYEMLIQAFIDAGRYDEAKGVAFAAQARRLECARSEHPEIRAEIDHLREWTTEEVERLRQEHQARGSARS